MICSVWLSVAPQSLIKMSVFLPYLTDGIFSQALQGNNRERRAADQYIALWITSENNNHKQRHIIVSLTPLSTLDTLMQGGWSRLRNLSLYLLYLYTYTFEYLD